MAKKRDSGGAKKPRQHKKRTSKRQDLTGLGFVELVEIVRRSRIKAKSDEAFNEIERRMLPKIKQLSYKFRIPGNEPSDTYQEALLALKTKAIKDYDPTRGNESGPYPFEKFAVLCMRRHLSTKLKASYQNKKKVLNQSISLDQERNDGSEDSLYLSDIIPRTEGTVLDAIETNEYYRRLFRKLIEKLSPLEYDVFMLYCEKYPYEYIADRVLGRHDLHAVKSIDNALSRIKTKGRNIYKKYGQE